VSDPYIIISAKVTGFDGFLFREVLEIVNYYSKNEE